MQRLSRKQRNKKKGKRQHGSRTTWEKYAEGKCGQSGGNIIDRLS